MLLSETRRIRRHSGVRHHSIWPAALLIIAGLTVLGGCAEDDCATCVEVPPVAPTQVYSESGDGRITVYWNDYPEIYNPDIEGYDIWSRIFRSGDEQNPAREFFWIGTVAVGENYDPGTGQYFYDDLEVDNAEDYEYAVSSYTASAESYLSFEFIVDTPLPMSESPLVIHDVRGTSAAQAGFDFSLAAEFGSYGGNGDAGVVDPTAPDSEADVQVRFDDQGIPWAEALRPEVRIQDAGTFVDAGGGLDFAGVSWAPSSGWSGSGMVELIRGHVYVVEIYDEAGTGSTHYAKLGLVGIDTTPGNRRVSILWAYQLVEDLRELTAPEPELMGRGGAPQPIRL